MEVKVQAKAEVKAVKSSLNLNLHHDFSSDLAGFVDRPISEMLDCALLDPSAGSPMSL
jgi:hypothetical protein